MILKLNKEIYSKKAIQKAISVYKKITNFKLREEGDYFFVSGSIGKADEELVKNEFLNFVLSTIRQ